MPAAVLHAPVVHKLSGFGQSSAAVSAVHSGSKVLDFDALLLLDLVVLLLLTLVDLSAFR